MTAWVLVVHLISGGHPLIAIPGIASQQECERLNDVLIVEFPHHLWPRVAAGGRPTNDARCLSYEMAK
jgi:hypothetical protein